MMKQEDKIKMLVKLKDIVEKRMKDKKMDCKLLLGKNTLNLLLNQDENIN